MNDYAQISRQPGCSGGWPVETRAFTGHLRELPPQSYAFLRNLIHPDDDIHQGVP